MRCVISLISVSLNVRFSCSTLDLICAATTVSKRNGMLSKMHEQRSSPEMSHLEIACIKRISATHRQARADVHVSSETKVFRLEDLVGGRVRKNSLGVNASLVSESAEASNVADAKCQLTRSEHRLMPTNLLKGTEICTASATRFSRSRSAGRLYLALTPSGLCEEDPV